MNEKKEGLVVGKERVGVVDKAVIVEDGNVDILVVECDDEMVCVDVGVYASGKGGNLAAKVVTAE